MKDLKQTIVATAPHSRKWAKILYKPYMMTAAAVAVLAVAVFALLLPAGKPEEDAMLSFVVGETLVQVMPILIVSVATSVAALAASAVFAAKSHRAMQGVLGEFPGKALTRQRRGVLAVELVFIMLFLSVALALPLAVLALSALTANSSGMMLDEVATPLWPWVAVFFFTFAATFALQCAATFARACFREIPQPEKDGIHTESAEKKEPESTSATTKNTGDTV